MHIKQKTKIFISCGQKSMPEIEVAKKIKERIANLGFEPYLAIEQQTLNGLVDNIFSQLLDSEYYILIDFRRDQLYNSVKYRGSLYTNQELAVAAYLQKEVIAFQHESVINMEGMLSSIQLNPIRFFDINYLPELIEKEILNRNWEKVWKNRIQMNVISMPKDTNNQHGIGRYFHLSVKNLHKDMTAFNCTAYIKSIINKSNDNILTTGTVELKWAGSNIPSVAIMPNSYRLLDAFMIMHDIPKRINFQSFSDSSDYLPPIDGIGNYEIIYQVLSENFSPTEVTANIELTGNLNSTRFF